VRGVGGLILPERGLILHKRALTLSKALPKDFATTGGALIFKNLNDALCTNAAKHDAVCVDVRPVLNGPTLDQHVDENSPRSMRAVARALLATKVPELRATAN
jgi:hypothetical protein